MSADTFGYQAEAPAEEEESYSFDDEDTTEETYEEDDAQDSQEDDSEDKPKAGPAQPQRKGGMSKQGARKTAEKTLEVLEADSEARESLALLYGTPEASVVDLAAQIMTSRPTEVRAAVDGLKAIRDAEGLDKVTSASELTEANAKKVWGVLHHLGLVERATAPKDSLKAAMSIVKATDGLDAATYENFEAALELTKKG